MEFRFVAAAGPGAALHEVEAALCRQAGTGLRQILDARGLKVWATTETPTLAGRNCALVGQLFDRASGAPLRDLPQPLPADQQWVDAFWGPHVLLSCEKLLGLRVLRDPSGSVPVYWCRRNGLHLYGSDMTLLSRAVAEPFPPDLAFVRQWLTFPFLRTARTGLAGVREILPGCCHRAADHRVDEQLVWSPWRFASPAAALPDFDEAASLLRSEIVQTVNSLSADHERILIQLSGGLDSSIVAASLAAAGKSFDAVTFATAAPDGDERRFARQVADRFGIALTELIERPDLPDFKTRPHLAARPSPNALLQPLRRALNAHFGASKAGLVLDGAGGDNVFAYLSTSAPVIDAFRDQGWRAALSAIADLAQLHGCTFWTVARSARRQMTRRADKEGWTRQTTFLAPDGIAARRDPHPWLEAPPKASPGKRAHVAAIVGIQHFIGDPMKEDGPAQLHPLLAQPVLELCLRIPTWLWVKDGRDRAVARAAFRNYLPDPIVERRGKGSLGSMFARGYMDSRDRLQKLLVGGILHTSGLIDAAAIQAYLGSPCEPQDARHIRLLEISAAETWLRSLRAY